MTFLALEFSSDVRSVAVARDGVVLAQAEEAGGRQTRAFGLIEQVLQAAGLEREAIEAIAVGLGPGSYTGIRVAISVAQGWQLARGVRLLGVAADECLAEQAAAAGLEGEFQVAIDAQRNEFYHAGFAVASGRWARRTPLRLATLEAVRQESGGRPVVCAPELAHLFPGARGLHPQASAVARLAAGRTDSVAGELLQPVYLREVSFVKAPPARVVADE